MTELRRRGGGGDPDSTENISDKVIYTINVIFDVAREAVFTVTSFIA